MTDEPLPEYDITLRSEKIEAKPRRFEHEDGTPVLYPQCFDGDCAINECNPHRFMYRRLLRDLHAAMRTEDDDPAAEAQADAIREAMDPVWQQLTEDERTAMRAYSVELYGDDEPPNLEPQKDL